MKLNTKNLFSSASKKSKYVHKKSVQFSISNLNTKEKQLNPIQVKNLNQIRKVPNHQR